MPNVDTGQTYSYRELLNQFHAVNVTASRQVGESVWMLWLSSGWVLVTVVSQNGSRYRVVSSGKEGE